VGCDCSGRDSVVCGAGRAHLREFALKAGEWRFFLHMLLFFVVVVLWKSGMF